MIKYSQEVKQLVIKRCLNGETVATVCKELNIPASTAERWVRTNRNGEKEGDASKRYEKTINGFLVRVYRNMQSRITGVQKNKAHLYVGKELDVSRETFYSWSLGDASFNCLFSAWIAAGYDRRLTPSIDRIDSSKGYFIENMRWITHSMNSKLGNLSRQRTSKRAIYAAVGLNHD